MTGYSARQKSLILEAVRRHFPNAKVFAFGSRVGAEFRTDSDLDLFIDEGEPISFSKRGLLRDELEQEAQLPYRVDLVFDGQISDEFKTQISGLWERWL